MKKTMIALSFIALAMAITITVNLLGRGAVSAQTSTTTPYSVLGLPAVNVYALASDNMIYVLTPGSTKFSNLGRAYNTRGNLIGIDFRPADADPTSLYGVTDLGFVYKISLAPTTCGASTLVSTISPRFAGGCQSLMDFNPVVNAVRLIGSNDQNFALVNSTLTTNLDATAKQTTMAYAQGDVNQGVDPNIACGTYTNNLAGATSTLFYGMDYDLDTLVTISTKSATGSSNTGGGQLQTIGNLVDTSGRRVNIDSVTDIDCYTDLNGKNTIFGINAKILFTLDLNQLNPNLALGTTQNVVVKGVRVPAPNSDGFIDIAVPAPVKQ